MNHHPNDPAPAGGEVRGPGPGPAIDPAIRRDHDDQRIAEPAELWGLWHVAEGRWSTPLFGGLAETWASRDAAQRFLGTSAADPEKWEPRLIGVAAGFRAHAELLHRIATSDPDAIHDEVQVLEPGKTAMACRAIDLFNAMSSARAVARINRELRAEAAGLRERAERAERAEAERDAVIRLLYDRDSNGDYHVARMLRGLGYISCLSTPRGSEAECVAFIRAAAGLPAAGGGETGEGDHG